MGSLSPSLSHTHLLSNPLHTTLFPSALPEKSAATGGDWEPFKLVHRHGGNFSFIVLSVKVVSKA